MNNYITIRELSKLMHVSVHQIRYFEEKRYFSQLMWIPTTTVCMEWMRSTSFLTSFYCVS